MIQGSSFKSEAELKLMGKIHATFGHVLLGHSGSEFCEYS